MGSGHADRTSAALRRLRPDAGALGRRRRPVSGAAAVRAVVRCATQWAKAVDAEIFSAIDPLQLDNVNEGYTYAYYTLLVLNTRSTTSFQYYQTGSPFEYELVRLFWATKRKLDVEKY